MSAVLAACSGLSAGDGIAIAGAMIAAVLLIRHEGSSDG